MYNLLCYNVMYTILWLLLIK